MGITVGYNLLLVAICLHALWRGGMPEQLGGLATLVASASTSIAHLIWETGFRAFQIEVFIIDALYLIFMIWLAFRANRSWPTWATAVHSTTIAVHLAKAVVPTLDWPFYAVFVQASSFVALPILWLGTIFHRRRLKRIGSDPPWRSSFAP